MKKRIKSYVMRSTTRAYVAFYFLLSLSLPAQATAKEKNFLKLYPKELSQVESYLNNITNLSSQFIQESSDGNLVEGNFFLLRPGKMRIEYNDQPQILITVNGSVLAYKDIELDEVSYLRTNTTPASFLTRKNISFSSKDTKITNVEKTKNHLKISVVKKNRKEAGEFSLIFKTSPLRFVKMEVKNDLDQIVTVTLLNPNFTKKIPKRLFVIKNKNLPQ